MWFIGIEVKKETSAPPPKKNPGSTPEALIGTGVLGCFWPLLVAIGEAARDYISSFYFCRGFIYSKNKDDKNTLRLMQWH